MVLQRYVRVWVMASGTAGLSRESGAYANLQAGHAGGELVLDAAALQGGMRAPAPPGMHWQRRALLLAQRSN